MSNIRQLTTATHHVRAGAQGLDAGQRRDGITAVRHADRRGRSSPAVYPSRPTPTRCGRRSRSPTGSRGSVAGQDRVQSARATPARRSTSRTPGSRRTWGSSGSSTRRTPSAHDRRNGGGHLPLPVRPRRGRTSSAAPTVARQYLYSYAMNRLYTNNVQKSPATSGVRFDGKFNGKDQLDQGPGREDPVHLPGREHHRRRRVLRRTRTNFVDRQARAT